MNKPFVGHTEKIRTLLHTDRGLLPTYGVHAIAGIRLQEMPFCSHSQTKLTTYDLIHWAQHMEFFWKTIGEIALSEASDVQIHYELRIGGKKQPGIQNVGLFAKVWATAQPTAVELAGRLAGMLRLLCPPQCAPELITQENEWHEIWQPNVTWLAEIGAAGHNAVFHEKPSISPYPKEGLICDWLLSEDALRDVWDITARAEGRVCLAIAVCPTRLFPSEQTSLKELCDQEIANVQKIQVSDDQPLSENFSSNHQTIFLWEERKKAWQKLCFMVRLRLGGDPLTSRWVGTALAASLSNHQAFQSNNQAALFAPQSVTQDETARFNWNWSDFQPWYNIGLQKMSRIQHMMSIDEVSRIAGIWGIM